MPAHPQSFSPARPTCQPHAVYTESPLRNVQLQSDVKAPRRRLLRPAISEDPSRRDVSSVFQDTIYDVLGSSEPVDLLPHVSKRAPRRHRMKSVTALHEDQKASATEGANTETDPTTSTKPTVQ